MLNEIIATIPKFETFDFWFVKNNPACFDVYSIADKSYVGGITPNGSFVANGPIDEASAAQSQIQAAVELNFNNFQLRPEWYVSEYRIPKNSTIEDLRIAYMMTMMGVALLRARKGGIVDVDEQMPKLEKLFTWLEGAGFYTGPSSTQYHHAFVGGNLYHHMDTMDHIKDLWHGMRIFNKRVRIEDAVLVASVHDYCKIDAYESYTKKMPNPQTGNWEPTTSYKYKDNLMPLGHGVSSMFLAGKFFRLTNAEALAIRWHMGAYRCVESETHEMYQAVEKHPLVLMLQFADQLSTTNYPEV